MGLLDGITIRLRIIAGAKFDILHLPPFNRMPDADGATVRSYDTRLRLGVLSLNVIPKGRDPDCLGYVATYR